MSWKFSLLFLYWTLDFQIVLSMKEVSLYKHPLRMPCRFPVKRQTYVRDPLDCSIFYTCYGNRYWKMTCETPHTIWSLKYKVCVWQNTAFDDCNYADTKTQAPPIDLQQRDQDAKGKDSKPEPWEKTSRHWVTWKTDSTLYPYTPWVPFTTTSTPRIIPIKPPSTKPVPLPRTTKSPLWYKPVTRKPTTQKPLFIWERKTKPRFTWRIEKQVTTPRRLNLRPLTQLPFTWKPPTTQRPPVTNRPTTVQATPELTPRPRPTTPSTPMPTTQWPTTRRPLTRRPTTRTTPRPTTRRPTTRTTPRPTTRRPTTRSPTTPRPTRRITPMPNTTPAPSPIWTPRPPTVRPRSIFTFNPKIWKQRTWKHFTRTPTTMQPKTQRPPSSRRPFWNIITKRPVLWLPRKTLVPQIQTLPESKTPRLILGPFTTFSPIFWKRVTKSPQLKLQEEQKSLSIFPKHLPSITTKIQTTKRPPATKRPPITTKPTTTKRPTTQTLPVTTNRPTTKIRNITWLPRITWRPTTRPTTATIPSTTTSITTTLATTKSLINERQTEMKNPWKSFPTPPTTPIIPDEPATLDWGSDKDFEGNEIVDETTTPQIIANERNSDKCGILPTPMIIGGKPSTPGRWPWQVSLQIIAAIEPWHRCGGVLIHPSWVLTAAHCVEGPFYGDLRNWRIVLAEDNLNEGSGREVYRKISRIVAHPGYIRTSNFPNDVALLQMDEPVDTSTGESRVACLPDLHAEIPPNANCWLSGWGETRGTGGQENSMNELQVEILPNWLCSSMWRRVGIHVLDDQVCVGYGDTGACYVSTDCGGEITGTCGIRLLVCGLHAFEGFCMWIACGGFPCLFCLLSDFFVGCKICLQGDSGGPLMCELDGRYYVTGVMSWLINNCSARGFPNVFTRVTSYTDWIYEKLEYYDWWH